MAIDPQSLYQKALTTQGYVVDPAQARAVDALQACFQAVEHSRSTQASTFGARLAVARPG